MTDAPEELSPIKRALLAIDQLQAKLDRAEAAAHEPVAVVGLGCRLPGDVADPASFWKLLVEGTDATSEVPPDRWDVDELYDPDPDHPGTMVTRRGGFLGDVRGFEPQFFGISPREAASMDPQQRLLLEVAWEALEHAGIAPDRLGGSRTGVFVGVTGNDYAQLQLAQGGVDGLDPYYASGVAHSIVSGRLSYVLGLRGPSLTLDTACSSSLVAVHLAVQSLRAGECRMALAGGVNLILSPENSITLSRFHMLAPDGRCKAFAAEADGFGRGEGCGVVVVKLLRDALADGDRVLAVVRGSAVNQDGASSGLTAPNGPAQEAVIRDALRDARIDAAEVGYVEAHGTGTALGDPIEMQALTEVYDQRRASDRPLLVGSVKSNIGHVEAAAGVAGLLKVVLALQHGAVPATLHVTEPNPLIDWASMDVAVPTALTPWPGDGGRRLAGVSAFGFSGTNAHLILESPPVDEVRLDQAPTDADAAPALLVLSGRTGPALAESAARWAGALTDGSTPGLLEVCATGSRGRAHLGHRVGLVAASVPELRAGLEAVAAGDVTGVAAFGELTRVDPPKVAFVMSGQGSQWVGMGRALYGSEPEMRRALDRCAAVWSEVVAGPGLLEVLWSGDRLGSTEFTQPALFALEWSLAQLWESWGVVPGALLGHSVGEVVAATLAGVMAPEDGLRMVAERGRLMGELPAGGSMAAIMAPSAEVERVLDGLDATARAAVGIAAVNGAAHTVVSGATDVVEAVTASFVADGTRVSRLEVSHAFHSPLMDPMVERFGEVMAGIALAPPTRRVVSNVTGAVAGSELTDPAYWVRHVSAPVRFADGVTALRALGAEVFVEIGPHPVLVGMAAADGPPPDEVWVGSLRRGRDDRRQVLTALAGAHVAGVPIAWERVEGAGAGAPRAVLPSTLFRRDPYWLPPVAPRRAPRPSPDPTINPILGRRLPSPLDVVTFESEIGTGSLPLLADHRVFDTTILPGTAFLEAALGAAAEATGATDLYDVLIHEALPAGAEPVTVQTIVRPEARGAVVEVFSLHEGAWTRHLTARAATGPPTEVPTLDVAAARARCGLEVTADEHYAALRANELDFGPSLRGVQRIHVGDDEIIGELAAPPSVDHRPYRASPALVDAAVQVLAVTATREDGVHLPFSIDRVEWRGPLAEQATSHVLVRGQGHGTLTADVNVHDAQGDVRLVLHGLVLKRADRAALARLGAVTSPLLSLHWEHREIPGASVAGEPADVADGSLDPVAAVAAAEVIVAELPERFDLIRYQGMLDAVEDLSTGYVVSALGELGLEWSVGRRVALSALPVAPTHRQLLDELVGLLVDDGVLRRAGDEVEVLAVPAFDLGDERRAALLERYPAGSGELALTARCGEQLAAALRGDVDPLQLLFPGGSLDDAERMYQHSPFSVANAELAAEAVAAAVTAGPERPARTRPLRVLEIGGGTGGTTAHLVPRLPHDTEYTFTDISPHFLPRARQKFEALRGFTTAVLDIEGDLAAQGFRAGAYDLVVAANVLHATADLAHTFANVAGLLAPGGLLIMSEMVRSQRFISITFGLTEGWWRFRDTDLRPSSLLLDRDSWVRFLGERGFVTPTAVPAVGEAHPDGMAMQAVIVAGAPTTRAPDTLPAGRRSWLVLADATGVGDALAAEIRSRGGAVVVAGPDTDPGREAFDAMVASAPPGGFDVAVHLWNLDPAVDPDAAVEERLRRPLGSALHLCQALVAAGATTRLCLVTRAGQAAGGSVPDPDQATAWGLARTVALEHPELAPMTIDLDPSPVVLAGPDLLDAVLAEDAEDQVALRAGSRLVPRLRSDVASAGAPALPVELAFDERGTIDALELRPLERRAPGPGEVEVEVVATALNFKDVLNVLDMYPGDPGPLGSECAGVVVAVGEGTVTPAVGDAVIVLTPGCMRSHVTCRADEVVAKPPGLGFAEAAGTLIAHVTARVALAGVAGLRAGERVLIHAAAGGVGLAAVAEAQRVGAEVFATAGSERKRALLRALGVAHVYGSRTLDFADEILSDTAGAGVDVVLNSLAGDAVARSVDVLAPGGRFVEIGKRGDLTSFPDTCSYHPVDWGRTAAEDPASIRGYVESVVADAAAGTLLRLPVRTFPFDDAPAAFRHMAQGRHVGKVVLETRRADAQPEPVVHADGSYLVTGGLGGLGLLTATHLAERGARHLVLMGRHQPGDEAEAVIRGLRDDGVAVTVALGDVSVGDDVDRVVAMAATAAAPLRGVVHSAGMLADGTVGQLDWGRFAEVLRAKVDGARHLTRATASHPVDLFVAYGSIASYFGSPGQANHSAANAALDALAHRRAAAGQPSLTIAWGAWTGVGAAVDRGVVEQARARGLQALTPAAGLAALDTCLARGRADVAVSGVDWAHLASRFRGGPPPVYSEMVGRSAVAAPLGERAPEPVADGRQRLLAAPTARRPGLVLDLVRDLVARVLDTPVAEVGDAVPLSDLGLDSLMAVELRNLLGTLLSLDEPLPATVVFDHPSVAALAEHLLTVLGLDPGAAAAGPAPAPTAGTGPAAPAAPDPAVPTGSVVTSLLDDMENLTDDEIDAMLSRRSEP